MSANDRKDDDIEIIPPDAEYRRQQREEQWVRISIGESGEGFGKLPLHKRLLIGAAVLASALALGLVVFLIVASAILIWIPLLLATAIVSAAVLFFRSRFSRR